MIETKNTIFLFLGIVAFCESRFVDTLRKCNTTDSDCQKMLLQEILSRSANGIPDLGIPPTDPFVISNESVDLGYDRFTFFDGNATGVKDCRVNRVWLIRRSQLKIDFTCDLVIISNYKLTHQPPNPQPHLFGFGDVNGGGVVKIRLEKLDITANVEVSLKEQNGDIYIDIRQMFSFFSHHFGGIRIETQDDFLYINGIDKTHLIKEAVENINEHLNELVERNDKFGKEFVQKGMDILFDNARKFVNNTPAKYFIVEDLSRYAYIGG